MGIKLSDIARQAKRIVVDFSGYPLNVTFNPNNMTPRKEAAFRAAAKEDEAGDTVLGALCEVVTGWDLLDDQEQVIPVTIEALRDVPNPIILAVLRRINEENGADPTKPTS